MSRPARRASCSRARRGSGRPPWWRGVDLARLATCAVLFCRPAGSEAPLSFAGLGDLFSAVPDEVVAGLPGPQRHALDVALLRVADSEGRPPDHRAVCVAALGAVRALAASEPLLIAVDDLQWLDGATGRVLDFVVRRLRTERVALLATERREPEPRSSSFDLEHALPPGRLRRLTLGPLSLGALHHVVRARGNTRLSRPMLLRLHRASGGNPLFALEIARAMESADVEVHGDEPLPVPRSLRDLLEDRLGRLPAGVRDTLLVLASTETPTDALVQAAGERLGYLEEGVRAGVIERDGQRIRFTHPLLASVLVASFAAVVRRDVHRRLASIVRSPEERARHLALATEGPDAFVAQALDEAARAARARGAPDAAAELGELARKLTPPSDVHDLRRRTVAAAEDHLTVGDVEGGRALLEDVLARLPAGPARADALVRLARTAYLGEGFRRAATLLRQALDEAGDDPHIRALILQASSFVAANLGNVVEAEAHAREALAMADRLRDVPALLASVLGAVALSQHLRGGGIPRDALRRAAALDVTPSDVSPEMRPDVMGGRLLAWSGELDEGRRLLERAYRFSSDHGEEVAVSIIAFYLAELEVWAGRTDRAREHAEVALEISGLAGNEALRTYVLYAFGLVSALRGDVHAARAAAREGLEMAERTGSRPGQLFHRSLLGFVELSLGELAAAHEHLEPLHALREDLGVLEPDVFHVGPDEVEALVGLGRAAEAEPIVVWLEERGRTLGGAWALATGARCRGLVHAAAGRLEEALVALDRALVEHERLAMPFELGRTLLVRGTIQRRMRRKRPARESLGRALEIFEDLGAPLWAERARRELARVGGRPPSPGELTETERRVAELVATGLTNRAVADALFMSPHTVDANLRRVYRKLGIRSRTELARAL